MSVVKGYGCGPWPRRGFLLCAFMAWLIPLGKAHAICGLDAAVFEQIRNLRDPNAAGAWRRHFLRDRGPSCVVCHLAGFGPRNPYGSMINVLLTGNDRENSARKREAGRRVSEIPANPFLADSPTFGDLIGQGLLPASDFRVDPAYRIVPARPNSEITARRARELVREVQADSRLGVLQLSQTHAITPEVAKELAGFEGEFLILGLKTLDPGVAKELADSRAAHVWLHSVTGLMDESAGAIAKVRGHLVLSGLADLKSAPLARKLVQRPGALSFPYLKQVTPEVAAELGKGAHSLTLPALTNISPEIQDALAETVGALTLPGLISLNSPQLTRKLAAGFASSVLLPEIKALSVQQASEIALVKRPFFLGGTLLPLSVMTEEIATVFANNPGAGRLELVGRLESDAVLKILARSSQSIGLRDVEALNQEQVRILATVPDFVPGGPFGTQIKISLPRLKSLDSPLLAETLLRCSLDFGSNFGSIRMISTEAATALANAPVAGGRNRLSFPSLEQLDPKTARTLMTRPWSSISLPALRDVSPETVRLLAGQTCHLSLGITTLSPESASAFADMASNEFDLGGGTLEFPCLGDLSPKAARALATSLNRGTDVRSFGGLTRAPQLFLGGRNPGGLSFNGSCPRLTPELAAELANYLGRLSIAGVQELPPRAAAALVTYRGPRLELSGPATDKLSPDTAAALAMLPATLDMPLRVLDSAALAEKFALQSSRTTDQLEEISAEAIPAYVGYKGFFTLRQLLALDSPALASRLIQDSTGQVLPSLRAITPAAAKVLATGPSEIYLGLALLDDPEVVRALAVSRKGANLPRLRAATPEVIAILRETKSIKTPALESIHVLSESRPGGRASPE
ncbi:MAG: hypothetical protein ACKO9Z_16160 [Planctomycetota bacterium]